MAVASTRQFEIVGSAHVRDLLDKNDMVVMLLYSGGSSDANDLKVNLLALDKDKDYNDIGLFWVDIQRAENKEFLESVRFEHAPEILIYKKLLDQKTKAVRSTLLVHLMAINKEENRKLSVDDIKAAVKRHK